MTRSIRLALWLGIAVVMAGCGAGASSQPVIPNPSARGAPDTPSGSSAPPGSRGSVFVIVMENTSLDGLRRGPYLDTLARQYAVATNYHDVGSPSAPNYLAMTSGSTWGLRSDAYLPIRTRADLGDELTAAAIPWRAYMEDLPRDCRSSTRLYAVKHNPFAYYNGRCPANVVPLIDLAADLRSRTPSFVWITPNLCHDDHDCGVAVGDAWMARIVPQITASAAWQNNGVLFIVTDESPAGHAAAVVVAPHLFAHVTSNYHDHYSLLASIEDRLGVARLGRARGAQPFTDLVSG